jgi:hypothetical protein
MNIKDRIKLYEKKINKDVIIISKKNNTKKLKNNITNTNNVNLNYNITTSKILNQNKVEQNIDDEEMMNSIINM